MTENGASLMCPGCGGFKVTTAIYGPHETPLCADCARKSRTLP